MSNQFVAKNEDTSIRMSSLLKNENHPINDCMYAKILVASTAQFSKYLIKFPLNLVC